MSSSRERSLALVHPGCCFRALHNPAITPHPSRWQKDTGPQTLLSAALDRGLETGDATVVGPPTPWCSPVLVSGTSLYRYTDAPACRRAAGDGGEPNTQHPVAYSMLRRLMFRRLTVHSRTDTRTTQRWPPLAVLRPL